MLRAARAAQHGSIERDVFPTLVGDGLYGYVATGYWLDIGTPERYLQATFDILDGAVTTSVTDAYDAAHLARRRRRAGRGRVVAPALVGDGARIADGARVERAQSCSGAASTVGEGAHVDGAVVLDGAAIGAARAR